MGGIIAYWGDLIGRKYGKKRLSWFGLRPKYTAILITSISGGLISILTITVLFLLVPPIRDIIMEGESAIRRTPQFRRDIESLKQTKVQLLGDVNNKQAELARKTSELRVKSEELQVKLKELAGANSQRDHALVERDRARAMESQATAKLAAETAKLAERKRENAILAGSNKELAEGNVRLHDENEKLVVGNKALAARNTSLTQTNERLTHDNEALLLKNAEYTKQNEEVAKQNLDLIRATTQLTKLRDDLDVSRRLLAERTKELSDYNAQLEDRNTRLIESAKQILGGYNTLREAYNASRTKRVVVHKDEDLARTVVPDRSSPEDVRKIVQNLLSDASRAATARGAAGGDQLRAVQVANRVITVGEDGNVTLPVSGDERVDELVRKLAYQQTPTCLLAVAVANSVEEEPAAIDLVPRANRGIYTKGQQVAVHKINAGRSVEEIFDDIVGFLRGLGQNAVQEGMIPRMDSTGEPQVGSLTAAEIAKLVESVREYNGYVRIRAIANSDIRAADPLALSFKVEP
jgi:uncharacterized protein (DUF3084 family)